MRTEYRGQPEARAQVEGPQVEYISMKGLKMPPQQLQGMGRSIIYGVFIFRWLAYEETFYTLVCTEYPCTAPTLSHINRYNVTQVRNTPPTPF
jgi:hypothetical protein